MAQQLPPSLLWPQILSISSSFSLAFARFICDCNFQKHPTMAAIASTAAAATATRQVVDVAIVGGGIIGCATARHLKLTRPGLSAVLLEKERELAVHQSGHNSGVLHAGIYYTPGSLKAKLCVQGIDLAYEYLDQKAIPYKRCGKLIVALDGEEVQRLESLYERAQKNNCRGISMVNAAKIGEIEPHCRGVRAIWSPYTGIVDWALVTRKMAEDFQQMGGQVQTGWQLTGIGQSDSPDHPIRLEGAGGKEFVLTCAGLYSDRVAKLTGGSSLPKIVPFRGEYLKLREDRNFLVRQANIYPVPDPRFPFLGVHFTPTIHGDVLLGPNAVLAFSREGYELADFSAADFFESICFRGMRKLMAKHASVGLEEFYRSLFKGAQVKLLQRYIPELRAEDVQVGQSGVRAQALDADGNLVDDFVFDSGQGPLSSRLIHVRNAPSPGATSSLAIARMIVDKSAEQFGI